MQHHSYDPGKDFVRRHEQGQRHQAQQRFDRSDRPWEHQDDSLLRKHRRPLRQFLILSGLVVVLVIAFALLLSLGSPAGVPQ